MNSLELYSFVQKFKQLWHSGVNAHLDAHTRAGQAWVSLHVQLGQAPGPLQHPPHRQKVSASRQRRKARRAAERKKTAEEAPNKDAENVETEAAKGNPTSENDEVGNLQEQEAQVPNDELYPDDIYHQAESESIGQRAFRCQECRMLFLPTSHLDGSVISDFNSCQRHIGVQKCPKCKIVLVGLAKIGCHRQVCQHSA